MKKFIIKSIKKYQSNISANRPATCRYTPTCSKYAIDSIEQKGVIIGGIISIKRIITCNALGPRGYDPVSKTK